MELRLTLFLSKEYCHDCTHTTFNNDFSCHNLLLLMQYNYFNYNFVQITVIFVMYIVTTEF